MQLISSSIEVKDSNLEPLDTSIKRNGDYLGLVVYFITSLSWWISEQVRKPRQIFKNEICIAPFYCLFSSQNSVEGCSFFRGKFRALKFIGCQ